jgi:alkanesulfonate monooxygenase SsuD/methylene tetrahydromethanopterin reductase-like flavin-dependent oxidoreductase (luciferase family)
MKISVSLTDYSWSGGSEELPRFLATVASAIDERPFDTLWIPDHLLQADPDRRFEHPMLEAYTTLGFLAATTTRVRLGTMVTWASIRPPAVVVKAVTSLDVLSGGRAWLGLGAGYQEREALMMGLPFPITAQRFDHLDDVLILSKKMWLNDESPLTGKLHEFGRPICRPAPVTHDGPSILIGGIGEKRTLPLVARYGDACSLFDVPDGGATITRKPRCSHESARQTGVSSPRSNDSTPSTPPTASTAAATCTSKCVSTPPITSAVPTADR